MAESVQVQMEDGSTKSFPAKWKAIKESTFADGAVKVKISFVDGRVRSYNMPASCVPAAAASGAEHKFAAAYTGVDNVDDMIEACDQLQANLERGDFTTRVEGNGFGGSSILVRALGEYLGKNAAEVRTMLDGKDLAYKMTLRKANELKPIIARIEAQKAARTGTKAAEKAAASSTALAALAG